MFNVWTVTYLLFVGVIAGYLARLLVKGADPTTARRPFVEWAWLQPSAVSWNDGV